MQRVYKENEWGKVSKRIITILQCLGYLNCKICLNSGRFLWQKSTISWYFKYLKDKKKHILRRFTYIRMQLDLFSLKIRSGSLTKI